jgi:hypothetical protein
MVATRKLPVAYNPKRPKSRGEFLVPQLVGSGESSFIGIKTGRQFQLGAISYVGMDVTPEMLLERFCERNAVPAQRDEALRRLTAFVEGLQSFKIANVVAVSYAKDSLPQLRLESQFTQFPEPAPLP